MMSPEFTCPRNSQSFSPSVNANFNATFVLYAQASYRLRTAPTHLITVTPNSTLDSTVESMIKYTIDNTMGRFKHATYICK